MHSELLSFQRVQELQIRSANIAPQLERFAQKMAAPEVSAAAAEPIWQSSSLSCVSKKPMLMSAKIKVTAAASCELRGLVFALASAKVVLEFASGRRHSISIRMTERCLLELFRSWYIAQKI